MFAFVSVGNKAGQWCSWEGLETSLAFPFLRKFGGQSEGQWFLLPL